MHLLMHAADNDIDIARPTCFRIKVVPLVIVVRAAHSTRRIDVSLIRHYYHMVVAIKQNRESIGEDGLAWVRETSELYAQLVIWGSGVFIMKYKLHLFHRLYVLVNENYLCQEPNYSLAGYHMQKRSFDESKDKSRSKLQLNLNTELILQYS